MASSWAHDWEYEALFDAQLTEMERRLWQSSPTAIRAGRMGYRTRPIRSGDVLEIETYPIFGREASSRLKAARRALTPEKIAKNNERAARRKLERLLNTNFTDQDIHITLTYMTPPADIETAQKDVRNFLRRVKRIYERQGLGDPRYVYTIEDNESGQKKRIHCHMVLSGGVPRETLEALWARGYANADRLQPDEHGLRNLAKYLTKQNRDKNRRRWCASRNLKQPEIRESDSKLSNRKVARLAKDLPAVGREILEKAWPKYQYVDLRVNWSDITGGCYIRAEMRRRDRCGSSKRDASRSSCALSVRSAGASGRITKARPSGSDRPGRKNARGAE
jgi:hypothetical protein